MCLRALEPEDLDLLYTIENDRRLWWVGSQTAPLSRYQLRGYIAGQQADIYKDGQVRYVIEADDGTAAGLIDLFNFSPRDSRAEVGVVVLERYRHHGLAAAALRELVAVAREVLQLHQLYAIVSTANAASLALFSGCGFTSSATLPSWRRGNDGYDDCVLLQCVFPNSFAVGVCR